MKDELFTVRLNSKEVYLGTKENCEYMKEYFDKVLKSNKYITNYKLNIQEVFPNCFVNRLKKGATVFSMSSLKDGSDFKYEEMFKMPSISFGFTSKIINPQQVKSKARFYYTSLFDSEEDALKKFNEVRCASLLDDAWDKNIWRR